jgi:hypothetical protein
MLQKQLGPGALRRAAEAKPELSRPAGSGFINISIERLAQRRRPASVTCFTRRPDRGWRHISDIITGIVALRARDLMP